RHSADLSDGNNPQASNRHLSRQKPLHQGFVRLNSGFSLLEVMVALAILAISLTTLIGSQHQSMFVADDNDFSFVAAQLASAQMAEVITSLKRTPGGTETIPTSGDFTDVYPGYRWQVDIKRTQALFGSAAAGLEQIDLKITDTRRERSFALRKYRYATGQM
ncbi:MAG: prepilin-type N-terminal cleavage/methylation domain-containing protein, partial [Desulfocapsaceae bacterium]